VMVSAPPVKDGEHNQRLEALCTAYAAICKAVDVPFVDIFHPLLEAGYLDDLADGIHPGPKGNDMIAGLLAEAEALRKSFAE
ncbi:MAG: lipolytic enzyme, G-D-S-L, partial [Mailhella sp.]|nr:lipolytic enzyme, G-D-S-L [Mailhella sp.]